MDHNDHSNGNGNGHGAAHGNGAQDTAAQQPHILIRVTDPLNFALAIDGTFPNHDYALNMLDQARRELEAQWRLQRAAVFQQQQRDALLAEQVRAGLAKGR